MTHFTIFLFTMDETCQTGRYSCSSVPEIIDTIHVITSMIFLLESPNFRIHSLSVLDVSLSRTQSPLPNMPSMNSPCKEDWNVIRCTEIIISFSIRPHYMRARCFIVFRPADKYLHVSWIFNLCSNRFNETVGIEILAYSFSAHFYPSKSNNQVYDDMPSNLH